MDSIDISEEESHNQKSLLRKIDLKIVPLVTFLYMLSYLDRISIGNAKLEHLESDLGLIENQYNWVLCIFFFGHILFEVPSNLILYKIKHRLSIWISVIMLACGIIMILMIFVKNFLMIMIARFFLGFFEAGLIPGMIYYITIWYKRSEQNSRVSAVLWGPTFAGALSGLLSYAIISLLDSKAGLSGWQWIFLVCGVITIIVSIVAYFLIFDSVDNVKWLNNEERKRVSAGIKRDGLQDTEEISKDLVLECLKDWKVCVSMFIFCGISVATYSFSFFIPSIINGFGFNEVLSQLLVVPPFILGCISEIGVAFLSDRANLRGPYVILFASIGMVGYAIVGTIQSHAIFKYIGTMFIAIGAFPCRATSTKWLANNIPPSLKRNIGISLMVGSGGIGGIIATQIYRSVDYPNYYLGHLVASICLFLAILLSIIQFTILKINNDKMKKQRKKIRRAVSWNSESEFGHFL